VITNLGRLTQRQMTGALAAGGAAIARALLIIGIGLHGRGQALARLLEERPDEEA
jgi:hypothetical protein